MLQSPSTLELCAFRLMDFTRHHWSVLGGKEH